LKNYFKKTKFISELIVILLFFYIFIVNMGEYTWGHDNLIIILNASIVFSCLLSAYRIFIYEVKEANFFISLFGRTGYYIQRFIIVAGFNFVITFIIMLLLYFYRKPEHELWIKFLYSMPPVIVNILMASVIGVIFSPVILSIHQVIHGIFMISVGINISAIGNLFNNPLLNTIFNIISFIFPPIEHVIRVSVNPIYNTPQIISLTWGVVYTIIFYYFGLKIFNQKNIMLTSNGSISID